MADLFDVSVGGAGFHLTSHIIALAALFIACFAIAGYISFRDDSISSKKLKKGPHDEGVLDRQGDTWIYRKIIDIPKTADATGEIAAQVPLVLAKDSVYYGVNLVTITAELGATPNLTLVSNSSAMTVGSAGGGFTARSGPLNLVTAGRSVGNAVRFKTTDAETHFALRTNATTATLTNVPQVWVQINWVGPAPVSY